MFNLGEKLLSGMKSIDSIFLSNAPGHRRLIDAISEVFAFRSIERPCDKVSCEESRILIGADRDSVALATRSSSRSFSVLEGRDCIHNDDSSSIQFAEHRALPRILRGQTIVADEVAEIPVLPNWLANTTPLATKNGAPIWALDDRADSEHHYVSTALPELNLGDSLFCHFNGGRFVHLLPLIVFCKMATRDREWRAPALCASFMFDDPNLHWKTYGYMSYADLLRHAEFHHYHACMATVPIDSWFVHQPTARLFRENPAQLSLLIHGNDHLRAELGVKRGAEERRRALRQALVRIKKLENRSRVDVSRVMAPPHGACGEDAICEMAKLGYEAACVSRHSLATHNPRANWLWAHGMRPVDVVCGLAVLPRFPFSRARFNSSLIAALLDQPIIAMGHHTDLANGLGLLEEMAKHINSFGKVKWSSMQSISRSRYAQRIRGSTMRIRMFSKRIEATIPDEVENLEIERAWREVADEPLLLRRMGGSAGWNTIEPDESISVAQTRKVEVASSAIVYPVDDFQSGNRVNLWAGVRRQMAETRDRLLPFLRR